MREIKYKEHAIKRSSQRGISKEQMEEGINKAGNLYYNKYRKHEGQAEFIKVDRHLIMPVDVVDGVFIVHSCYWLKFSFRWWENYTSDKQEVEKVIRMKDRNSIPMWKLSQQGCQEIVKKQKSIKQLWKM